MRTKDFLYHCPICINDFTDGGVKPFQCLHLLCVDCDERFKNSNLKYNCPLCKSNSKNSLKDDNKVDLYPYAIFFGIIYGSEGLAYSN